MAFSQAASQDSTAAGLWSMALRQGSCFAQMAASQTVSKAATRDTPMHRQCCCTTWCCQGCRGAQTPSSAPLMKLKVLTRSTVEALFALHQAPVAVRPLPADLELGQVARMAIQEAALAAGQAGQQVSGQAAGNQTDVPATDAQPTGVPATFDAVLAGSQVLVLEKQGTVLDEIMAEGRGPIVALLATGVVAVAAQVIAAVVTVALDGGGRKKKD